MASPQDQINADIESDEYMEVDQQATATPPIESGLPLATETQGPSGGDDDVTMNPAADDQAASESAFHRELREQEAADEIARAAEQALARQRKLEWSNAFLSSYPRQAAGHNAELWLTRFARARALGAIVPRTGPGLPSAKRGSLCTTCCIRTCMLSC